MNRRPARHPQPLIKHLAISVAFGLAGALAAPLPASATDLLSAVRAAAEIDPVLAGARLSLQASKERVIQAAAGLKPTVNLNSGVFFNSTNTSISPQRAYDSQTLALVGNLPLYRPANRATFQQSEISSALAELQLRQARQDLAIRVASAYFDVLAAQDSLAVVQAQKRSFTEQFESAKRNFEVGTATITDQQEAQSRLDLTRAQEVSIRNDLEVKRALLAQLIGKPVGELHTLRRDLDIQAPVQARETDWAQYARENNVSVRQAELSRELASREIARQSAGHRPTLDFIAQGNAGRSAAAQTSITQIGVRNQFAQVGLQLAFPLYAGGAVDARVRESIALQAKSETDLDNARRTAEQTARQTFLGVRSGIEQIRALTEAERSSQLALESNQLGYQVGVRINIDVLNAAQQLFTTQRDLARARYDVLLNGLRLRNTAGVLDDDEIAVVSALLEPARESGIGATTQGSTFPVAPAGQPGGTTGPAGVRGGRSGTPQTPR
ncbi:MAG: TolC family outer membrane protein, partial [Burkholderiaceae bacterium]